jgi:hypothetical protein
MDRSTPEAGRDPQVGLLLADLERLKVFTTGARTGLIQQMREWMRLPYRLLDTEVSTEKVELTQE